MATYITRDGDTIDYIVWKFYGYQDRLAVEQVLAANRDLADRGAALPANIAIELPALVAATTPGVKLWD